MPIHCDSLNNEFVFSDDRALLHEGGNGHIQEWLSGRDPQPHQVLYEMPPLLSNFNALPDSPDLIGPTMITLFFSRGHWRVGERVFRCAVCLERDWQVLGPEIDPRTGRVIGPSPVVEVIVRETDQPPVSVQTWAELASRIWAGLTDAEREQHPRIGQMADLLDLDALL